MLKALQILLLVAFTTFLLILEISQVKYVPTQSVKDKSIASKTLFSRKPRRKKIGMSFFTRKPKKLPSFSPGEFPKKRENFPSFSRGEFPKKQMAAFRAGRHFLHEVGVSFVMMYGSSRDLITSKYRPDDEDIDFGIKWTELKKFGSTVAEIIETIRTIAPKYGIIAADFDDDGQYSTPYTFEPENLPNLAFPIMIQLWYKPTGIKVDIYILYSHEEKNEFNTAGSVWWEFSAPTEKCGSGIKFAGDKFEKVILDGEEVLVMPRSWQETHYGPYWMTKADKLFQKTEEYDANTCDTLECLNMFWFIPR